MLKSVFCKIPVCESICIGNLTNFHFQLKDHIDNGYFSCRKVVEVSLQIVYFHLNIFTLFMFSSGAGNVYSKYERMAIFVTHQSHTSKKDDMLGKCAAFEVKYRPNFQTYHLPCEHDIRGRFVTIKGEGHFQFGLCEVQVYGKPSK